MWDVYTLRDARPGRLPGHGLNAGDHAAAHEEHEDQIFD
jgi:hypothetical protein